MALFKKLLLVCCLLFSWQASAAEIDFSGFATIAGGLTSDDDETLAGYDNEFSFDNGSLIALQASSDLGNGWGVTTQLLARGSEAWDLNAEWAYVSYDASDNWRLLFGRQRAPFYMYSDFLDVSYAYHWIKPPSNVYSLPFDVFDGIGSIYSGSVGDFDTTFQLAYGRNRDTALLLGEERDMDFQNIFSASYTMNMDWFTLRASYAEAELSIPFDEFSPLLDGVVQRDQLGNPVIDAGTGQPVVLLTGWRMTPFASVADELEIKGDKGTFASIGFTLDFETVLVVGEFAQVRPDGNFSSDRDAYYLTLGKRFGDVMLHLTVGADERVGDRSIFDDIPAGIGFEPLIAATTQNIIFRAEEDSEFYTVGLRWEVSSSVAAKFEYTSYENAPEYQLIAGDASLFQFALTTVF
jgi:porin-like protein